MEQTMEVLQEKVNFLEAKVEALERFIYILSDAFTIAKDTELANYIIDAHCQYEDTITALKAGF